MFSFVGQGAKCDNERTINPLARRELLVCEIKRHAMRCVCGNGSRNSALQTKDIDKEAAEVARYHYIPLLVVMFAPRT